MTTTYLDTSAAMKLLVDEIESAALLSELTSSPRQLVASWLLHTELHFAARRYPTVLTLDAVTAVVDAIALADVTRGSLTAASNSPRAKKPELER